MPEPRSIDMDRLAAGPDDEPADGVFCVPRRKRGPAPTPDTDSALHAVKLGALLVEVGAGLLASYYDSLPEGEARAGCVVALGPLREALKQLQAVPGQGLQLLGVYVEEH